MTDGRFPANRRDSRTERRRNAEQRRTADSRRGVGLAAQFDTALTTDVHGQTDDE